MRRLGWKSRIGVLTVMACLSLGFAVSSLSSINTEAQSYTLTHNYNLAQSENENLRKYYIENEYKHNSYIYQSNDESVDFSSGYLLRAPSGDVAYEETLIRSYTGEFNIIAQPVMQNVYASTDITAINELGAVPDYTVLEFAFEDLYSDEYLKIQLTAGIGSTYVKLLYSTADGEKSCGHTKTKSSEVNICMLGPARWLGNNWQEAYNTPLVMRFDPSNPETIKLVTLNTLHLETCWWAETELPSFENYSVSVRFGNRDTETDSLLMLYELCGQRFSGDSVTDTANPTICAQSTVKAVKGYPYALPNAYAYDIIDGDLTENIITEIESPSGTVCLIENGNLAVTEAGIYTVTYTVTDKNGKTGVKTLAVQALEKMPDVEKEQTFALSDDYARYSRVKLPDMTVKTGLTDANTPLEYYITVQKEYRVKNYILSTEKEKAFIPEETGRYDIVYVFKNEMNLYFSYAFSVEVKDKPYFEDVEFEEYIHCGKEYVFPKISLISGEKSYAATVTEIQTPNGRQTGEFSSFTPTVYGEYSFTYTASYESEQYQKTVSCFCGAIPAALFENEIGCSVIESNVDLPAYSKEGNGVMVLGEKKISTFTYSHLIDVSALTSSENLIQFQVLNGEEYATLNNVTIELIDENNPNNVVKIKIYDNGDDSQNRWSYILVNYDGRDLAYGIHDLKYGNRVLYRYGTLFYSSFKAGNASNAGLFSVQMDYGNKQFSVCEVEKSTTPKVILDAGDESIVGAGNAWQGFSTGRVYMRISMSSITGRGGIVITEIAGRALSGETLLAPKPYIVLENSVYANYDDMPDALVGSAYPIPKATGYDSVFGESAIQVEVLQSGENTGVHVDTANAYYVFPQAGTYTIRYTATNLQGEQTTLDLTVEAKNSLENLGVAFADAPQIATVGNDYLLPEIMAFGGSGIARVEYTVYYNEKKLSILGGSRITLTETGDIRYVYEVSDYLGSRKVGELSIPIEVNPINEPVLWLEGVMPLSVRTGERILLLDCMAVDYNFAEGQDGYYAEKWIEINGQNIGDVNSYLVTEEAGTLLRIAFCSGESRVEKFVRVIASEYSFDGLIFDSMKASVSIAEDSAYLLKTPIAVTGDNEIALANRVSQNDLVIRFSVAENANAVNAVTACLSDSVDSAKKLLLVFTPKNNDSVYMQINGVGVKYEITGSLNKEKMISIVFDGKNQTVSMESGEIIALIETYRNGEKFDGFTRGGVEFGFQLDLAEEITQAVFNLIKVSNQTFAVSKQNGALQKYTDLTEPLIYYFADVPAGLYAKGTTVVVPMATAYDVIHGERFVKVSLVDAKGNTVFDKIAADADRMYTLNDYGRYKIVYYAVDGTGREYESKAFYINVRDDIAPTLSMIGELPSTVEVGGKIVLPAASAEDNYSSVRIYVFIYDSNMRITIGEIGKEHVFVEKGTYKIVYRAVDDAGNCTELRHTVRVGE